MVLSISIPPETEAKLKARAEAAGQDLPSYISRLIDQAVQTQSVEPLSGPIAKAFVDSRMTEDELVDLLEQEKHAMRAERRAGRGK